MSPSADNKQVGVLRGLNERRSGVAANGMSPLEWWGFGERWDPPLGEPPA